jgi:DNA polymerase-3 subunit delta
MDLSPILLIHGGEAALSDRALQSAIDARREFEKTTLNASDLELGRYGEVVAPSLFAEKRLVIVKELQDVSAEVGEEIISSLDDLDGNIHLIFLHRGGVKGKGLVEKLKKSQAEVIICEPMKRASDKAEFVRSEFIRHGRKISNEAILALVNATGSDTRELAAACSQIAFDTNAGKSIIDETDISNYYQGRVEATGFDVADAVMIGDSRRALAALRNAIDSGTDPVMIVAAIASSVRTLAKVSDVPRQAKSFELAGRLGLAPWQIDKARTQLNKWRPGMIAFAIGELATADIGVKGGSADPEYALERAVLAISGAVAAGQIPV